MNQRTGQQNKALHKYFATVATTLNDAGYDVVHTLRHDAEVPWNPILVKDMLWRPLQVAMVQKTSTAALDTSEIDKVYSVLNKHLGEKLAIHVPFPSDEPPMMEEYNVK